MSKGRRNFYIKILNNWYWYEKIPYMAKVPWEYIYVEVK